MSTGIFAADLVICRGSSPSGRTRGCSGRGPDGAPAGTRTRVHVLGRADSALRSPYGRRAAPQWRRGATAGDLRVLALGGYSSSSWSARRAAQSSLRGVRGGSLPPVVMEWARDHDRGSRDADPPRLVLRRGVEGRGKSRIVRQFPVDAAVLVAGTLPIAFKCMATMRSSSVHYGGRPRLSAAKTEAVSWSQVKCLAPES